MSPVLDQQLAGFLAKLSTIAVLWTVAFTLMTRAQVTAGTDEDAEPLIWSDVEREIERAERRDQRARRPHAADTARADAAGVPAHLSATRSGATATGPVAGPAQASAAPLSSSSDSSAVWLPPHCGHCSTWRHERSRRVPSGFKSTTNDSEMGSISKPK